MGLWDRLGSYKKFKRAESHKEEGDFFLQEGNFQKAVECYRQAVEAMPDYHEAYYAMAKAYEGLGQQDKVTRCMNKARELEASDANYQKPRKELSPGPVTSPDPVTSQQPVKQHKIELPVEAEVFIEKGEIYEHKGELQEALKYYQRAAKEDPNCALAYLRQGQVYVKKKYISKAWFLTKRAHLLEPKNPEILHTLGVIRTYQHDYPEAVRFIRQALNIKPGTAIVYNDLGIAYLKMGKLRETLECFRKAVELDPDNREFRGMLAEVEKAFPQFSQEEDKKPSPPPIPSRSPSGSAGDTASGDTLAEPGDLSPEQVLAELNRLVGQETIKKEVESLVKFLKVQKLREEKGLPFSKISQHAVFYGLPGTGKITVARLLGKLFKAAGILSKGHLIEVDRSELVAEYAGQTAIKTDKVIDSARHGILFIHEAYTLAPSGSEKDFGFEAIDTILKRMEDDRHQLVVIAAGCPDEMQRFLESNPVLKSRFNRFFYFEDYKPEKMLAIFRLFCTDGGFRMEKETEETLRVHFESLYQQRDRYFGNGRVVRNLFERVIRYQAVRISDLDPDAITDEALITITANDAKRALEQH
ncbi:MAG: tetratricopeptide repeat protein [Candidatus Aminicenantes bacterium]|jgi:tetratricopeptide (TPR) repeat protein/AAA+ superfamily predicted ATPase